MIIVVIVLFLANSGKSSYPLVGLDERNAAVQPQCRTTVLSKKSPGVNEIAPAHHQWWREIVCVVSPWRAGWCMNGGRHVCARVVHGGQVDA